MTRRQLFAALLAAPLTQRLRVTNTNHTPIFTEGGSFTIDRTVDHRVPSWNIELHEYGPDSVESFARLMRDARGRKAMLDLASRL